MPSLNIDKNISFHELTYGSGRDDSLQMFRVCCTGEQARDLADELEQKGWMVKSIVMTPAMSLDTGIAYVARVGENKLGNLQ